MGQQTLSVAANKRNESQAKNCMSVKTAEPGFRLFSLSSQRMHAIQREQKMHVRFLLSHHLRPRFSHLREIETAFFFLFLLACAKKSGEVDEQIARSVKMSIISADEAGIRQRLVHLSLMSKKTCI